MGALIGMFVLMAGFGGYAESKDRRFFHFILLGLILTSHALLILVAVYNEPLGQLIGPNLDMIDIVVFSLTIITLGFSIKNWKYYKSVWKSM